MPKRIVDACCLINLYASRKPVEILQALGGEFFVPERVLDEALTIRRPDEEEADAFVREPIDLTEAIRAGAVRECRVEGRVEFEYFVRYAMELADGEAACLTIAKARGWIIATDDKKAIRMATAEEVAVITTPELLHQWVESARPDRPDAAEAIRNIQLLARFRPAGSAAHYEWWMNLAGR
jgi:predicted nucleic acid-binding protein